MTLISRKVFSCSGYICCFVQIVFNIFDATPLVLALRFQDLILIVELNSEFCPLFETERFAKVDNNLELLTIFAKRFVLHDWWSSESASNHCNLLVFYVYLLLLLLLYLHVAAITCLFELTTVTSVQHSTEPCTEVALLTLRGKNKRVQLFRYCWPFSCQCSSCVETIQLICAANRVIGFYIELALAWKRLIIYLYYLVIINILPFNRRFAIFLFRTVLESNQILTNISKNVKM